MEKQRKSEWYDFLIKQVLLTAYQSTAMSETFVRFSHWFSGRSHLAIRNHCHFLAKLRISPAISDDSDRRSIGAETVKGEKKIGVRERTKAADFRFLSLVLRSAPPPEESISLPFSRRIEKCQRRFPMNHDSDKGAKMVIHN
ncbi:hypothetical protein L484_022274 [Morus notabilis]|uniref:Uncharacterized protein n=1 Tax=Morus notabilis TaxID=981085 RepID=W9S669_9ROSA|nr:hypothetical protein L484_022274 [Morus notabilis]